MKNKAFTLVELLLVSGIIGLLTLIALTSYKSATINSRNQQRKANLTQLRKVLESYANDNAGRYPSTGGQWWGNTSTWGNHPESGNPVTNNYIPNLAPAYIPILPRDPNHGLPNSNSANNVCKTDGTYNAYLYNSNGIDYKLIVLCLPEGTMSATDFFYDPQRPTWAWQVSTPGGLNF